MKHYFVVNPRSFEGQGTLEKFFAEVEGCLEDGTYQIHMSQRPREAISAIWSYRHSIPRAEILRVYAVGGDGILFDCLNGVMGIWNAELAAVPYGKQNDFVRSFGEGKQHIFRDIDSQVKAAARPVDVVRCGNN
jgi:diacylglycerol kinase family enzyme